MDEHFTKGFQKTFYKKLDKLGQTFVIFVQHLRLRESKMMMMMMITRVRRVHPYARLLRTSAGERHQDSDSQRINRKKREKESWWHGMATQ